jgi:hypothetical protein
MVEEIKKFISRFVIVPNDDQLTTLAIWVVHTWGFAGDTKASRTTPYIYISSAEKQSGKSLLLEVLELIVCNPMRSTNVTSAVLFRAIDKFEPTLLLDEVDAIWAGQRHEELRGILNGGYKEGGQVWRIHKGEPHPFNTFSPKILAGINNGYLPDTIADRCIPITLKRKKVKDKVEPFFSLELEKEVDSLIEKVALWAEQNSETLRYHKPKRLKNITDRQWEISMPLVSIGEILEVESARSAISALLAEKIERNTESPREELLGRLRELFDLKDRNKVFTYEIIDFMESKTWTPKNIAAVLAEFQVEPKPVRVGNEVKRGYSIDQFEDIFDRCL